MEVTDHFLLRAARLEDVKPMVCIEEICFLSDRISLRSFRNHVRSPLSDLTVVQRTGKDMSVIAYGLVLYRTRSLAARLYSLAVLPEARGFNIAKMLLEKLELSAGNRGCDWLRLEVATTNKAAIRLYEFMGYKLFGQYIDYYEGHGNALRMQKRIHRSKAEGL